VQNIRVRLIQAGRRTPSAFMTFMAVKAASVILIPLFWLVFVFSVTGSVGFIPFLVTLFLFLVGWRLPDYFLDFAISGRRNEIVRNLPDALDLLVVSVEAGLGLDAAFSTVADKFAGVVGEEFGITMYEISLGKRRREALRDMADRCSTPELTTFLTAIIRAEQTGVNVGDILRVQADGMRVRRRQRAVEAGQQAPVKMLFPLVLGIFPALFIIVLGPAIIQALDVLAGI
jgi:tight adherence protein C